MNDERLATLFQYASEYRFSDFTRLFEVMEAAGPCPPDACLMRAQIGLFAADEAFIGALDAAGKAGGGTRFPCLGERWLPDTPNRFVAFSKTPGALAGFTRVLPEAAGRLGHWYGQTGAGMARQVHSEILYFSGAFEAALDLAESQLAESDGGVAAISAQYVVFRCHLAGGAPKRAERCMLEMVRMANADPACVRPYRLVRDWANLTTGWSGDTERFSRVGGGEAQPLFEDRLAAIRGGISRLSPLEAPFAEYTLQRYGALACTMRQFYMDVFNAMYWLQAGDGCQARGYFLRAYSISRNSGLIMPFVECGRQLAPLLRFVRESIEECLPDWLSRVDALTERYEDSLNRYRA